MNKPEQFESDSEISSSQEDDPHHIRYINVKKHLPDANPLLQKIQFQPYNPNVIYPIKLRRLPDQLRDMSRHQNETNMSKIQDSMFYHNKLKQKIDRLINGVKQKRELQGTLSQIYGHLNPYYKKFPDSINKYFATTTIDLKTIAKKKRKIANQLESNIFENQDCKKIEFDSAFQSGNLFSVYQKSFDTFDLILQNDINTRGNNQWFFFKVKNVPKGRTLKFHIVNFVKSDSLFNYGMKPTVFSKNRYQKKKIGWIREAQKVSYEPNNIRRQYKDTHYYTLSFEYKFMYDDDTVYFSHSYPYTYTDLGCYFQSIFTKKEVGKFLMLKNLAKTCGRNKIDQLTITAKYIPAKSKKVVWIIARQHPSEITSSFMIQGIINFLISDHKIAEYLRQHIIFKIIPMINSDGVIHGNSRCELVGSDPNRKWKQPNKNSHPGIYQIKKSIEKSHNIDMVLDLHSHSRKLGTFFYGNSLIHNPEASRIFPLFQCKNDERFSFENSRFAGGHSKTARSILFKLLKIPNVYTIQCSFFAYQKAKDLNHYLPDDYRKMGRSLLQNYACFIYQENPNIIENPKFYLKKNNNLKEVLGELKNPELIQIGDQESIGSDSNPSQYEFDQEEILKILPKKKGQTKKKYHKIKQRHHQKLQKLQKYQRFEKLQKLQKYQKLEKIQKKQQKECSSNIISQLPSTLLCNNNDFNKRTSQYMKRSQKPDNHHPIQKLEKFSSIQSRGGKSVPSKITRAVTKATQTEFNDEIILKPKQNRIGQEFRNLCVIGQKMEDKQVWLQDNDIGTQTYYPRCLSINRNEGTFGRKSLKMAKFLNLLQSKQNNFLLRDCSLKY